VPPVTDPEASPIAIIKKPSMMIASIVAVAFFMENLDSSIVATAIPAIAHSLGEPPLQLNLAITSYLLSLAVFMPVSGWIADRWGARTVFCTAIAIFTVGSALAGLSNSLGMMVAMRALQGLGGAMMTPVGRLILLRTFPRDRIVTAMMYMSIPAMIGPTMGPVVGGFLATYASWRWIFYVNIPIGLVGILLVRRFIDEHREPPPARFDVLGFVICGLGLASLQLAIQNLARPIGPPGAEWLLFAVAIGLLLLYVRHASRHENPAVDLKVLRVRTFRIGVISGSVCRTGLNAAPFLLPLLFQLGFGLNPLQSGLLTFVSTIGAIMMRPTARWLLRTLGFRRLLLGNAVLSAASVAGFALVHADTPHWIVLLYVLVFGFLRSTQFIGINTLSYAEVPPGMISRATSIGALCQQLSLSFGVAIAASLLAAVVGRDQPVTAEAFPPVFLFTALIAVVSVAGFSRLRPADGQEVSGFRPSR
jgi:EmrB/QacA subfamily drug resistance transporter